MLSVIITFFDETPYLKNAVQSVLSQDIPGREIIVVSDRPEAENKAFLSQFQSIPDTRIVFHPETRGIAAARNTGIELAERDFVCFLDADDFFVDRGLETQFNAAVSKSWDIAHAPYFQ